MVNIVEKNEGEKINIEVVDTKITLAGEMTLDLEKYERDFDVHIDICTNEFGFMMFGINERYVAQIDIPARAYDTIIDGEDEDGNPMEKQVPIPFNMDNVTVTLWAKGGAN
jgi:hypothetical protein